MMKMNILRSANSFSSPFSRQFSLNDALKCIQNVDEAESLFHYMLQLLPRPCIHQHHKLLTIIVKMENYSVAINLFKKMLFTGCPVDEYFMNSAIHCYSQFNRVELSFPVIATFLKRGFSPDAVTYSSLIRGFFLQRNVGEAVTLFKSLIRNKFEIDEATINVVLDGLCKSGDIDAACQLIDLAEKKKWKLNVISYTSMVDGFGKSGMLGDAIKLISRMLDRDISPNIITYNILLHGLCGHNRFDLACSLFNDLPSKGINPDLVTYNVMILGSCREGRFQAAKNIFENMEKHGFVANNITCNIILDGCIRHCDDLHSVKLLKQIVGRDFQFVTSTFFVLLGTISKIRQMSCIYDDHTVMQLMLKLVSSDDRHKVDDPEVINSMIQKVWKSSKQL